jgi:hypothetical protein
MPYIPTQRSREHVLTMDSADGGCDTTTKRAINSTARNRIVLSNDPKAASTRENDTVPWPDGQEPQALFPLASSRAL